MIYNFEHLSFQVMNVAVYDHRDGCFCVKARPHAALSYRVSGEGRFQVEGKNITVKAGDIIFIPADTPYTVEYSSSESIVLHLLDCNYREPEKITVTDRKMMESKFRHLLNAHREYRSLNRTKSCIYDIFAQMESEGSAVILDPDVLKCMEYMKDHYAESELTVEMLCADAHISHSCLQRKFRKYLGVTPKEYLTKLRMNKAIELFSEGGHSVRSIAYFCGYDDEKYFSRAFKRIYGCPPVRFNGDPRI